MPEGEWINMFGEMPKDAISPLTMAFNDTTTTSTWYARLVDGKVLRVEISKYIVKKLAKPTSYSDILTSLVKLKVSLDDNYISNYCGYLNDCNIVLNSPRGFFNFDEMKELSDVIEEATRVLKWVSKR